MRFSQRPARALALAGLAFSILAAAGCDSGPPTGKHPVHPAEGRVLFDGKPVVGAQVSLLPVDPSKFGDSIPRPTGQTDEEGRFKLMTYVSGDGAPEGDYLVSVVGQGRPRSEAGNLLESTKDAAKPDVLQGRFIDPKTSGLKATIKPGPNTIETFELSNKPGGAPAANSGRDR